MKTEGDRCSWKHLRNGNFVTTRQNAPLNFTIRRYESEEVIMNVTRDAFDRFPKESPFKDRRFNTCSIVGNGGILKGSGCGEEVDASEFVFRCNMAPMDDEYLKDIGKKTNLITINPGQFAYKYNSFAEQTKSENVETFVQDLSVYGDSYLWIPAFFSKNYVDLTFAAHQVLREIRHTRNQVIIPHPDFIKHAQGYWSKHGLGGNRATTGKYNDRDCNLVDSSNRDP
ncbi:alpha-2,8-sialyltransferase 8F-like [Branchiostoma floridae x Branchiostoma japonicum]